MNEENRDIRRSVYDIIEETSQLDVFLINIPSKWIYPRKGLFSLPNFHLDVASKNSEMLFGDQDYEPNHGLLLIASYLRVMDVSVDLYDMHTLYYLVKTKNINIEVEQKLFEMLKTRNPKIIGLSCMTPTLPIAKELSNAVKKILPKSKIVLGGVASIDVKNCFFNSSVDIVIQGEGEYVFYELTDRIKKDVDFTNLSGISYKQGKKIISNKIDPIRGQPNVSPAYYLLPKELELIPRVYTSRGCINQCEFCSPSKFFGNRCTMRPIYEVINEIDYIQKNYDYNILLIGDLTLYMNNPSFNDLCCFLKKNSIEKWWCQTQLIELNKNTIFLLKDAGCSEVALGFEDMEVKDEKIRKKNPNKKYAKKVCSLIKQSGIRIQGYWIFGTESETLKTSLNKINDMCEFIKEGLMDSVHISFFIPYPNVITKGYHIDSYNYCRYLDLESSFYDELPLYHTDNLTSKEIFLLTQLAISCCANEFYKKRVE